MTPITAHETAQSAETAKVQTPEKTGRAVRHAAHAPHSQTWPAVWFTLAEHEWSSIVIVPAHPDVSASATARSLVAAARVYEQRPVAVLDADEIIPSAVRDVIARIEEGARAGELTVIALPSPLKNQSAIPIARAADAAALLVSLGKAEFNDSRRTVDLIGRSRFIGAINLSRV
jgi:hypothetical protein